MEPAHNLAKQLFEALGAPPTLREWCNTYSQGTDGWGGMTVVVGPNEERCADLAYALLEIHAQASTVLWVLDSKTRHALGPSAKQVAPNTTQETLDAIGEASRWDPDMIALIDPITSETLALLCTLSLTGHRTLATLPAPDAKGALSALLSMAPTALPAALANILFVGEQEVELLHITQEMRTLLATEPTQTSTSAFERLV